MSARRLAPRATSRRSAGLLAFVATTLVASASAGAWFVPDVDGRCRTETDEDADGVPEQIIRYTPGAHGLVEESFDTNADGTPEVVSTFQYDDAGRAVRVEGRFVAVDAVYRSVDRAFDDADRIIEARFDVNGDGVHDQLERYTYDEWDRIETIVFDIDADGQPDHRAGLVYSPEGRLVRETFDIDADGTVNIDVRYRYTEGGAPLWEIIDEDGDGDADALTLCLDDPISDTRWCEHDVDGDGVYDLVRETRFDNAGHVIELDEYAAPNPSHNGHIAERWQAGERHPLNDRYLGWTGRERVAGIPSQRTTYTHDVIGRVETESVDVDRDGTIDRRIRHTYGCDAPAQ